MRLRLSVIISEDDDDDDDNRVDDEDDDDTPTSPVLNLEYLVGSLVYDGETVVDTRIAVLTLARDRVADIR